MVLQYVVIMAGPVIAIIFGFETFVICVGHLIVLTERALEHHRTQIINYVAPTNTNLVKLNTWEADAI